MPPNSPFVSDDLFERYTPKPGTFDEFFRHPGELRDEARPFIEDLRRIGFSELYRRREQAEKQLVDNANYFSGADPDDKGSRPWPFDVLPLMIGTSEWTSLSTGLIQRAKLLNLVIADLHGPRRLIQEGQIPPALLFDNPLFARAFSQLNPPEDLYLHFYAADLGRGLDGQWRVIADRTDSPSGIAYALENRIVSSGMFPDSFRNQRVQRLAPFFMALRSCLQRIAPQHKENPRIALVSAGPKGSNHFEDAYLSRYLGYTLVEGDDLTIRERKVQLKTLGGLIPIDVLFRRMREQDSDPLEFGLRSQAGVTGLTQAVRHQSVACANALGSGLLESPAFMAYLPQLCERLLGQPLLLPSVGTYWCGDPQQRDYVLANLNRLYIKPAFERNPKEIHRGGGLSARDREQLADRIRANPLYYLGQEQLSRSQVPTWLGESVTPSCLALRTFLVADKELTYQCMPGGLARVSRNSHLLDFAIAAGDATKDTWVLSDGPVREVTLLRPPGDRLELKRSGTELPSRVADNLFWLGRHAERAEGAARLLRTTILRLTGESGGRHQPELGLLLRILAMTGTIDTRFGLAEFLSTLPSLESSLPDMIYGESDASSLFDTLRTMSMVALLVRERLSGDSWRLINKIPREFKRRRQSGRVDLAEVAEQLNRVITDLAAFSGLAMESMTRTLGWRFLDMGRRIERSYQIASILHSFLDMRDTSPAAPSDGTLSADAVSDMLEAILESADSLITYRSRYLNNLQVGPVLDLLITDESNPRSLGFQFDALSRHVRALPTPNLRALPGAEVRVVTRILARIRCLHSGDLVYLVPPCSTSVVGKLLDDLIRKLPKLSELIAGRYILHADSRDTDRASATSKKNRLITTSETAQSELDGIMQTSIQSSLAEDLRVPTAEEIGLTNLENGID